MKLIATKPLLYAGQSLNVGDEFEASEKDAKLLKAIRKAEDAPEKAVAESEPEPALAKRTYKTRRMKADDAEDEDAAKD